MVIVFLGADGSGKSTIIDHFINHINNDWSEIKYVHFRPSYIKKSETNSGSVTNPHAGEQRGLLMSIIKLLYFVVEYNYAFNVHYRKPDQLVVFDRYYYDVLADPKRVKCSAPLWVVKLLMKLIPTPDLVFYLYAPVDVLYERKKEVNKKDLNDILLKYSNIVEACNFYKISSENSVQVTLNEILSIYQHSKKRFG